MDKIPINKAFVSIVPIPESKATDTVAYIIYKGSNGSIFEQGNCTYVAGINWKLTFTPTVFDIFIVEVKDQILDVTYSQSFDVEEDEDDDEPTTEELLTAVNKAIKTRLTGGAVQAYSIGGRNMQYMTLSELRNLRADLSKQIAAEKGGGRNYAKFVSPD